MSLLSSRNRVSPEPSFFAAAAIFLFVNTFLLPASWAAPKVVVISLDGATPESSIVFCAAEYCPGTWNRRAAPQRFFCRAEYRHRSLIDCGKPCGNRDWLHGCA